MTNFTIEYQKIKTENPKLKMFSVYMNGKISHCYISESKTEISVGTRIFKCYTNSVEEVKEIAEKAKIVTSIKEYLHIL